MRDADQRLAEWVRSLDEPSVAPLVATLQHVGLVRGIGLGYLSLDHLRTLSGGEAQRVRMVRHRLQSTDVTYVFDDRRSGLHPHDIQR